MYEVSSPYIQTSLHSALFIILMYHQFHYLYEMAPRVRGGTSTLIAANGSARVKSHKVFLNGGGGGGGGGANGYVFSYKYIFIDKYLDEEGSICSFIVNMSVLNVSQIIATGC